MKSRFQQVLTLLFILISSTSHADVLTNRSLAVTEVEILSRFSLQAVLDQLIQSNGSQDQQTPADLWDQWLSTNADCDQFNGFPISCRADELTFDANPFTRPVFEYQAIGLFNRFDLASRDGSDCGEYRLVFARRHNDFGQEKTLIFEARVPNPSPTLGIAGCAPIANFWANLSSIESTEARANALEEFYFSGLAGMDPVIHPSHLSRLPGSGQVRTNSFLVKSEWRC